METTRLPLTQKQIAEHLGVSRQLVGHALRGDGRVAESTRRQILELAQAQGYNSFSNQEARQMIARRYGKRPLTGIIAALFHPSFDSRPLTTLPFFMSFFDGLEQESNRRGLDLMLCPCRWPELPRLVQSRQVDGIISVGLMRQYDERIAELQLPSISLNHLVPGMLSLMADSGPAMEQIAEHLFGLGHHRIAFAGFNNSECRQRLQEFGAHCTAKGWPLETEMIDLEAPVCSTDQGKKTAERLLAKCEANPFTALVCANDLMAMGAYEALDKAGLTVPGDVSLIGFDDVSDLYNFRPRLASVAFDRQLMGERAVELLWSQNQNCGGDPFSPTQELFAAQFVPHQSTGPARPV